MPAGVAIGSLLAARGECEYKIYCIVSTDVPGFAKAELAASAAAYGDKNEICFITAGNEFEEAFVSRHISIGTYYRLMLPRLLPQLDKVIYIDTDFLFFEDLREIENIVLGDNLIAAAKASLGGDYKKDYAFDLARCKAWRGYNFVELEGSYFGAGFMLMNLALIRKENMLDKWIELSNVEFLYWDQCILNHTCRGRVVYIPPRFNARTKSFNIDKRTGLSANDSMVHYGYMTQQEADEMLRSTATLHYTGHKPWDRDVEMSNIFWHYAAKTPFYAALWHNYTKNKLDALNNAILKQGAMVLNSAVISKPQKHYVKLPKWLGKLLCLFILKRKNRHLFRERHIRK